MHFLKEVVKKHKLSAKDENLVQKRITDILAAINNALRAKHVNAEARLGGSAAKGTFIAGDFDVDIFVVFNESHRGENLSNILEPCLKGFKPERLHGSRDYFQFNDRGLKYEVIPVLDFSDISKIENITDASIRHVKWVVGKIQNDPKMRDEILLTKLFCKAQGVYGAESYIRGFSGHVVDILTIYYGSFLNLMKAAARWGETTTIDYYNVYSGKAAERINSAKVQGPLIAIDPIQPGRNASASLTVENYEKFKEAAQAFVKKPAARFFEKKKTTVAMLKRGAKGKALVAISATPIKETQDIAGTKMLKAFEFVCQQLSDYGFHIFASGFEWDKKKPALMWVVTEKKIGSEKRHQGPPIKDKKNAEAFRHKHAMVLEENGKLYTVLKRKHTEPQSLVRELLRNEYVRERVKSIKLVR